MRSPAAETAAAGIPARSAAPGPVATAAVLAGLAALAGGATWGLYRYLSGRVAAGTDAALRLAAVLVYVGVTNAYTLARALGIVALALAYASVLLALWIGFRRSRSEAVPGLVSVAHRQLGLLTLAVAAAHATVPFTSLDPPYGGWRTVTVPYGQPVSWGRHAAAWESMGIVALYLGVLTGPTFYLLRGRLRAWAVVHRAALAVYALSVAHAFLLGSDFMAQGPARVALLGAQVPLLAVAGVRLAPSGRRRSPRVPPVVGWSLAAGAMGAAAGMAVLAGLVAAGVAGRGLTL